MKRMSDITSGEGVTTGLRQSLEFFGGRENLAKSLDIALRRARQIVGVPEPGEAQ